MGCRSSGMFASMVPSPVPCQRSALVARQGERRRESLRMPEATAGLVSVFLQEVSKERLLRQTFSRADLLKTSEARESKRCDRQDEPRTG